MIKRTIEVSSDALYLHVRNRQLVLKSRDGTEGMVPDEGEIRFLTITDKQFGKMKIVRGKMRDEPPPTHAQLEFF